MIISFTESYITVGQTILLNKKHEGKVKSYKDLNNPKYIVTSKLGTTSEQAVKIHIPKCTYNPVEKETEMVQELITGKADAIVYDKPFCEELMAELGTDNFVFLDEPFTYEPLAWGIGKGDPGSPAVLSSISSFNILITSVFFTGGRPAPTRRTRSNVTFLLRSP